jgi:hypothetical protein
MATGALDANGVWIYGEDDSEATFSALLNKLGNSVSNTMNGKILQIIHTSSSTQVTSTSATYIDTGLTATITPSSATNKIIVIVNHNGVYKIASSTTAIGIRFMKNGSLVKQLDTLLGNNVPASTELGVGSSSYNHVETSGTTSPITYKTMLNNRNAAGNVYINASGSSSMTVLEVSA